MDLESGVFTHHHSDQSEKSRLWLSDLHLTNENPTHPSPRVLSAPSYSDTLSEARKTLEEAPSHEVVIVIGGASCNVGSKINF